MKLAVMLSVHPEHCAKMATGEKGVELRKRAPKLPTPFKCYVYCTKPQKPVLVNLQNLEKPYIGTYGDHSKRYEAKDCDFAKVCNGKVWAEFICDRVEHYEPCDWDRAATAACVSVDDIHKYMSSELVIHGLHISALTIYEKPREIYEFMRPCQRAACVVCEYGYRGGKVCDAYLKRPPQGWCYVEEIPKPGERRG